MNHKSKLKLLGSITFIVKLSLQQLTEIKGCCPLFILSVTCKCFQRTPSSQDSTPIFAQAPSRALSITAHPWLFTPVIFSSIAKSKMQNSMLAVKLWRFICCLCSFPALSSRRSWILMTSHFTHLPCTGSLNLHTSCNQKQALVPHVHLPQQ